MSASTASPSVTVLLSTHNRAKYLCAALDSMAAQTFTDWEWILVDDASTDETPALLTRYAERFPGRVQILRNPEKCGLARSLNRGLRAAKGRYIARMDDDDVSQRLRLARQVAAMEQDPALVLLGTSGYYLREASMQLRVYRRASDNVNIRLALCTGTPFMHPSVMMRAETLRTNQLFYDESYSRAQDYELWTRLVDYGRVRILEEPLLAYRCHPGGVTAAYSKDTEAVVEGIRQRYTRTVLRETPFCDMPPDQVQHLLRARRPASLQQVEQVRQLYEAVGRSSYVSAAEVKEAFARWLAPHLDARSARNLASWTGMRMLTASGAYVWPYLLERSARLMRHQFNRR